MLSTLAKTSRMGSCCPIVASLCPLLSKLPEESIVRVRKLQKGKARWRDVVKSKVFAKSERPRRPQQNLPMVAKLR